MIIMLSDELRTELIKSDEKQTDERDDDMILPFASDLAIYDIFKGYHV